VTTAGEVSHTYSAEGIYTITIGGTADAFGSSGDDMNDLPALTKVVSFGELGIKDLSRAFIGASQLRSVPDSLPSTVTKLYETFVYASAFNDPNIGNWDVSNVTNMAFMLSECPFNQDISSWNVSSVTDMYGMFEVSSSISSSQYLISLDTFHLSLIF